jgi:hypothetical protein
MSFRFTGQLNLRFGPLATLVPAMAFVVAGLLLLARTPVDATHAVVLLPAMILIGLGAGLGFPSLVEAPRIRVRPLPADVSPGGGCLETGTGVTIGCGGCAGTMTK